ncbi:hypothetical protein [Hymenobacter psychrotolerans]|uniref:MetA-pathway of phenol degradation n=1 Tax=Hymenobacter psychrotolerans DSM 18569 TaxID=1121959 RepID=A0A1M6WSW3_9BACT|nr:hypothetical protein [Hymenobacter psychrotolerans]SHK96731.1 hypothetical protein SAMN02746009_01886 [Hymenobacter psychrotolerans DSM 18569]
MQHTYRFLLTFLLTSLGGAHAGLAQSLVSGFLPGKGHGSFVISGTEERYQTVYLAPGKINRVPIFDRVQVSSLNLYGSYGLTDKLEAVISLPYIQSRGFADEKVLRDQNYVNKRAGLQDITLLLKAKLFSKEVGTSVVDVLGVVSGSIPFSDYKSDTGLGYIIAIGNGSRKISGQGVVHLKTISGVFFTGQAGYSLRDNSAPNAFVAETKIGYAGPKLYIDALASFQKSDKSGTDILQPGFTGFFPATRVDYVRLGISAFRPLAKGFGLTVGATTYVAGRNLGKSTGLSGGVAYNF